MSKRLKFYGWGQEGSGFDETERGRLFHFVADKLGVEPRLAAPPQEADIALRAPRIAPPAALANILTARPLRTASAHVRQVLSGNRARLRARLRQCAGPRRPAAERRRRIRRSRLGKRREGGCHSVRRRLLGRRRRRARRRRSLCRSGEPRHASPRPGARGRCDEPRSAHPERDPWAGDRGGSEAAWPRHQALPAKFRVLDPRRLDRDALRAAISPRSIPTSTISSKVSGRSHRRASWNPAACPVRARAPAPTA